MKKQLILIGLIILLISSGLSGCNEQDNTANTEKNKFIGTWQNTTWNITRTIVVFSNSSCSLSTVNETGTWALQDGKFVMRFPDSYLTFIFNYTFSNNDRTLSLSSAVTTSITQVFTKQ